MTIRNYWVSEQGLWREKGEQRQSEDLKAVAITTKPGPEKSRERSAGHIPSISMKTEITQLSHKYLLSDFHVPDKGMALGIHTWVKHNPCLLNFTL